MARTMSYLGRYDDLPLAAFRLPACTVSGAMRMHVGATYHSDENHMWHRDIKGRPRSEAEERCGDVRMHAVSNNQDICNSIMIST